MGTSSTLLTSANGQVVRVDAIVWFSARARLGDDDELVETRLSSGEFTQICAGPLRAAFGIRRPSAKSLAAERALRKQLAKV